MFKKHNDKLLEIAIEETGFEEGSFGNILSSDDEFFLGRILSITLIILTPYYKEERNQFYIDNFIRKVEESFHKEYGVFSTETTYIALIERLESLLKKMKK